jgi:spermidine dehydrogenase
VTEVIVRDNAGKVELGMDRCITRRDFLNGAALTIGATLLPLETLFAQDSGPDPSALEPFLAKGITQQDPRYYPPGLTGMRGSHPGSFEVGHELRDQKRWADAGAEADTGERYDLVVVGGGISGLSAAYFFRRANGPGSRILVLDNHDDFGGHAKRNEFQSGKHFLIGCGGTLAIERPKTYSKEAMGLLRELGIEVQRFETYYDRKFRESKGLRRGVFFDKQTFGVDRLVSGEGQPTWDEYLKKTPLSEAARKDILRLQTERVDYLPGLSLEKKTARLKKMSYKAFLLDYVKVHSDVIRYYQQTTHSLWAMGIDAVDAFSCIEGTPVGLAMGIKACDTEPYIYHFPDGNASIARLLVRSLVPGCAPGHTMEDIVTATMNYARLDDPSSPVRVRLNSTGVRVKHLGDPSSAREVEVTYVLAGKAYTVRGATSVLACYNMIIPYLCPEMPEKQKEGLAYGVKYPLVYTNVQISNWKAFQELGVGAIYCPGGYFSSVNMDFPVSIADYHYTSSPDEPCVLRLVRTPCKPGLPAKDQFRAGHWELFTTPFETFERNIRDQLGRMLGKGGFDPGRDIEAITVNRWPHGYAYDYPPLWDPAADLPELERPHVIGRQPFGRITIANSDSGANAETDEAIDQAWRAVNEVMAIRARSPKSA